MISYYQALFNALIPELILATTALVVLAADLLVLRDRTMSDRLRWLAGLAAAGCVLALLWDWYRPVMATLGNGALVIDGTTRWVRRVLLVLTACAAGVSLGSRFTRHIGEYFALLLLSAIGMMLLVSTDNLLMIFVALELTSLPLYILTAFHKRSVESAEAALKYFLFGGMAAAFSLFGISLLYGLSGELSLVGVLAKVRAAEPVFYVALVMTVAGFAFKVAAAPFHLWSPDVYQGAPTPVTAFIASGSKVASFIILARVMIFAFGGGMGSAVWMQFAPGWIPLIAILAVASMVLGNLAAIAQSNVKRLLAYSAVAHAGYALIALLTATPDGMNSLLYYVITYAFTALGAFGVIAAVETTGGDQLRDFAGLYKRSPVLALCMAVFLLSLAGIPPLAGFFGKFYIFAAAAKATGSLGLLWLVELAIVMSCVSLYYYLMVLKQIYVAEAPESSFPVPVNRAMQSVIVALALAVVVLGVVPDVLLKRVSTQVPPVAAAQVEAPR